MSYISIEGRRVYVATGTKTQTVRVCTEANERGVWAHEFRVGIEEQLTPSMVARHSLITELSQWLVSVGARVKTSGSSTSGTHALPPRTATPPPSQVPPSQAWLDEAVSLVDAAIDRLVREFLEHPYLHRVEHSLHTRLVALLTESPLFTERVMIGDSGHHTQPVHKEWPETTPRPQKDGRRGNFDLAILSPDQIRAATLLDFRQGRITAGIAIEMGLDYGYKHLADDHAKLINSAVPAGYLVDFRRDSAPDQRTRDLVLNPTSPIRTAYAHHHRRSGATFKTIGSSELEYRD
ncbi:hypothetical protein [Cryptosporangium sp. NPDC048952]|uniref:hypothetical protein n=1 Tax=Cryptosporangium sp. NPDC048952 TaxID=3363961 RepID=UPI003712EEF6